MNAEPSSIPQPQLVVWWESLQELLKHKFQTWWLGIGGILAAACVWMFSEASSEVEFIGLKHLPEITDDVIAAQGTLFRVEEPICFNKETQMGVFVVEILSTSGFEGDTHVIFGGDARSLSGFTNEVRLVNAGASRLKNTAVGAVEGVESLVSGIWQLLSHPIDTISGLGSGTWALAGYIRDTPLAKVQEDIAELADAYYVNSACEVAEQHGLDYFELKTGKANAIIHSETNFRLGGKATIEVLTFLVPFSKAKYGGDAAKIGKAALVAAKTAEMAALAARMAEAGVVSIRTVKFARASMFFPRMAEKMTATLARLKDAVLPSGFAPPVAKLGQAGSLDYRLSFFTKFPQLEGKVVIHHAIEQQALTRYPKILSETELHSLENLRGIPKSLDAILHKSEIRRVWDDFYRMNPASTMTKQKLLDKATEIDRKFGHLFTPNLM